MLWTVAQGTVTLTKLLPELPPVEATASCSHVPGLSVVQAAGPQVDTILSRQSDFECDTCEREHNGITLQWVSASKTKKCPDQLKCDPKMKKKL